MEKKCYYTDEEELREELGSLFCTDTEEDEADKRNR
jgi:hypothetical protein